MSSLISLHVCVACVSESKANEKKKNTHLHLTFRLSQRRRIQHGRLVLSLTRSLLPGSHRPASRSLRTQTSVRSGSARRTSSSSSQQQPLTFQCFGGHVTSPAHLCVCVLCVFCRVLPTVCVCVFVSWLYHRNNNNNNCTHIHPPALPPARSRSSSSSKPNKSSSANAADSRRQRSYLARTTLNIVAKPPTHHHQPPP